MEKGMKELIKMIQNINGERAEISISHKLYGEQKIRCVFSPVINKGRVGFNVNQQEIYIDENKINTIDLNGKIYFADDVMVIEIKTE